jgi:AcrR family transcriptional regulator
MESEEGRNAPLSRTSQGIRCNIEAKTEGKMAKVKSVSKSLDIAVRIRLLTAATELFSRKGYSATTTREIVAAAGVTKPVLYYYFRNKEGIYLELIRGAFAKFDALLDTSRSEKGSASERLLRLSDQIFSLFMENIEMARLMYSIYYGPHQGAPFFDFDTYHLKFQDTIRQLAKEGMRQGEFHKVNADDMMWAILGAVNVAMEAQLCHPELGMERKRLTQILKLILQGISTQRARQEEKRK